MYQVVISFQNRKIAENIDGVTINRATLKSAVDLVNTYYADYENHQYWKITGFTIEEISQ